MHSRSRSSSARQHPEEADHAPPRPSFGCFLGGRSRYRCFLRNHLLHFFPYACSSLAFCGPPYDTSSTRQRLERYSRCNASQTNTPSVRGHPLFFMYQVGVMRWFTATHDSGVLSHTLTLSAWLSKNVVEELPALYHMPIDPVLRGTDVVISLCAFVFRPPATSKNMYFAVCTMRPPGCTGRRRW